MSKTYSAGIVTAYGAAKRAGYQGTYEDFCRQQAGYAGNAAAIEQAKTAAQTAANTATTKAGEATTAATAAQTAKTQTEAAASQALTDISTARSGAISAVQTEGQTQTANARTQAQAAEASATTASTKASEASASATSAGQSATNAATSATSAANAASAAQGVLDSIPDDYSDLSEDVDKLKADLDAIYKVSKVEITQSTQYLAFEVSTGNRYTLHNGTNSSMNAHTISAPDSSGTAIEAIGANIQAGATITFEPTSDASYIRFYCNGRGTVVIEDISNGVPKLNYDVEQLQNDATAYVRKSGNAEVNERNTTFFTPTSNLFNKDVVVENYDIKQNGSGIYEASGYMATEEYIDVSAYNSIKPLSWSGNAVIVTTIRYVLYDANKTALNQRTNTNSAVDTSNAVYLRFGASLGAKESLMIVPGDVSPNTYIPYGFTFKYGETQTVEINPSDDIIQKLLDNKGKDIHFNSGAYDIISQYESHFGSDYFANYEGYTSGGNNLGRGLPVYNGTKMTFSQGAVFTAHYTGSNSAVRSNFAAFAIESGVTIDGLRLSYSGIRNGIHDDFDNSNVGVTVIKNCHLTGDSYIIAGGLALHDVVIIKNCYIERTNGAGQYDFSYHNNGNAEARSLLVIKDNYMANGVSIRWYGPSTLLTDVLVSNNSMYSDVEFKAENASATTENVNLKKWNNEIRSS